jgi:hypothetical protein
VHDHYLCNLAQCSWPAERREEVVEVVHVLHLLKGLQVSQYIEELVKPWDLVDASHDVRKGLHLGVRMSFTRLCRNQGQPSVTLKRL